MASGRILRRYLIVIGNVIFYLIPCIMVSNLFLIINSIIAAIMDITTSIMKNDAKPFQIHRNTYNVDKLIFKIIMENLKYIKFFIICR